MKKKFRVALFKHYSDGGFWISTVSNDEAEKIVEERDDFVRWLIDWVEYNEN